VLSHFSGKSLDVFQIVPSFLDSNYGVAS